MDAPPTLEYQPALSHQDHGSLRWLHRVEDEVVSEACREVAWSCDRKVGMGYQEHVLGVKEAARELLSYCGEDAVLR